MYPRSPGPTFSHGPSLVSKARRTPPSRLARGPAPFTSRGGTHLHRPACPLKRFRSQGSQNFRALRWPPQAPPHCAAVQANLRPARHRWRRCQATPPPLPPIPANSGPGSGGLWGAAWLVAPHTPREPPPKTQKQNLLIGRKNRARSNIRPGKPLVQKLLVQIPSFGVNVVFRHRVVQRIKDVTKETAIDIHLRCPKHDERHPS